MFTEEFIHQSIRYSLFRELNLETKPGLVCPNSTGCHTDMDYSLMSKSIECISKSFYIFIEIGMNYPLTQCLEVARPYAIQLEYDMLQETHSINTHKGAIYLFAITNLSLGYALKHHLSWNEFLNNLEIINETDYNSLLCITSPKTYGQRIYKEYGLTGIIGEVHHHLKSITNYSLPLLEQNVKDSIILISLVAHSNDTCILHHNDIREFHNVQCTAKYLLNLGLQSSPIFDKEYTSFCEYCNTHHISCGGSADLLALTFYLNILKKLYPDPPSIK